jgi:hypothetical protein
MADNRNEVKAYDGNIMQNPWMDDALINDVAGLSVLGPSGQNFANVARSGQFGTGIRVTKLDGATPAVFNPVQPVVLSVPTMWKKFPQKQEILRSLMETHAKSITGIDFSYELETADTQVGHDGQSIKTPTRTTRSQVNPSATFTEYTGNIVYKFFQDWIFDIQHPDTNTSILPAMGLGSSDLPGWTMSAYSMSMLFIQYDPTGLPDRIMDAFVIIGMFPTQLGEIGFERTIGTTTSNKERNIQFTGIVQHNNNTKELGMRVAEMLALHRINYNYSLPGLAGSVDPTAAIQEELRSSKGNGGINWEANAGASRTAAGNTYSTSGTGGSGDAFVPQSGGLSNGSYSGTMETGKNIASTDVNLNSNS